MPIKTFIPKSTKIGERSIFETTTKGSFWRIKAKSGSVTLRINCTTGLYGSGLTNDKIAAIIITHV